MTALSSLSVTPRISVVTPSFNQAAFIEEALWSVKDQNYPNLEHIVVDGASTDGTVEILKRLSAQPGWQYLRWLSEPDRGQSDALNKALQIVSGDIVGWLNTDDRYRHGCFSSVVERFTDYPHADVLYGDYTMIDGQGRVVRIRREIEFNRFILSYLHMLYVPTPSSFFRRRVFDRDNRMDVTLDCAMDYEFIMRLATQGFEFRHVPELWADFRVHEGSMSVAIRKRICELHDSIATSYSPILRRLQGPALRKTVLTSLRMVARGLRYGEKLFRGYYFEQFQPAWHGVLRWGGSSERAR